MTFTDQIDARATALARSIDEHADLLAERTPPACGRPRAPPRGGERRSGAPHRPPHGHGDPCRGTRRPPRLDRRSQTLADDERIRTGPHRDRLGDALTEPKRKNN